MAGGIGQTPFLALGRSWLGKERYGELPAMRPGDGHITKITLLYGARTAAYLAGLDDFRRAGIEVELATDDGLGRSPWVRHRALGTPVEAR